MFSGVIGSGIIVSGASPDAPSSLTITDTLMEQVDLGWTDNADNEDGFKIERAPDVAGSPGTWAQIDTAAADATAYSDTSVSSGTKYHWRVRAFTGGNNSDYSNVVTTTTDPTFQFTTSAGASLDPVVTVTASPDIVWLWPDNSTTSTGATPSPTLTGTGQYDVSVSDISKLTQIVLNNDTVTGFSDASLPSLTNLIRLQLNSNAGFAEDVSGWSFPASLQVILFSFTGATGDIGAGWTLPAALTILQLNSTSVSGDISAWGTLPTGLTELTVAAAGMTGDVSALVLPGTLAVLGINTLPSGGTFGYSTNGCFTGCPNGIAISLRGCLLTETEVDQALADCVTSGATGGSITLHGNNSAPSATGLTDKTTLEGRGWSVSVAT